MASIGFHSFEILPGRHPWRLKADGHPRGHRKQSAGTSRTFVDLFSLTEIRPFTSLLALWRPYSRQAMR
ncbi:hypothetical protein BO85DRAFT_444523 [Aspergillus piperis CBS 112811]|uniref:Uncharacterized protein n=1 Tax=Aspergillus piperis CBS 112811 TaxID=1448313 RepID=A0A8G1REI7_9EURO|nr:hypothetical protein BO85DRAFT_444523 [Aspergillus piperis CBS 112811]RAH63209.1 hypothetical protein BO85DRAFT_444523 [Aspergillus piperis CBS 112811]